MAAAFQEARRLLELEAADNATEQLADMPRCPGGQGPTDQEVDLMEKTRRQIAGLEMHAIIMDLLDDVYRLYHQLSAEVDNPEARESKHGTVRIMMTVLDRIIALVNLLAKFRAEERDDVIRGVALNDEWIQIRTLILRVLEPHPEIRAELAKQLKELHAG